MNSRNHALRLLPLTLTVAVLPSALAAQPVQTIPATPPPARRPNVVVIFTDDQPQRALGATDPYFHTPHLDQLAREGVSFENSFVTTAVCAVSRASLLTGQHMARHGINSFERPLSTEQMRGTYAGRLRAAGYRTAFLGKFAIGHPRAADRQLCLPADQFDLWYGFIQGVSYSQLVDGQKRYVTTVMEEKAIGFLREQPRDRPFLLILALPEPHGQVGPWNMSDPDFNLDLPAVPAPPPRSMTQPAASLPPPIRASRNFTPGQQNDAKHQQYMATVRSYIARADLSVGRIRAALRELNLDDNTVVVFTSDNGSMWGAHGLNGKWNMYEESIRVPLIVHDPRLPAAARGRRAHMALNIDLAPSLLTLAGEPVPPAMQGMDLGPILRDARAPGRSEWYYEHDVHTASGGRPLPRCEGLRTERWKYICYKDTAPVEEELFDLTADPGEQTNLAPDPRHAPLLAEMRQRFAALRAAAK
ncbi:MAG: DUF4976 domain-containing protein [Verrucomicrobia bacterium]|nr:DUF4976 domain-containing protein [Verrucomicrobiota bacterium]